MAEGFCHLAERLEWSACDVSAAELERLLQGCIQVFQHPEVWTDLSLSCITMTCLSAHANRMSKDLKI